MPKIVLNQQRAKANPNKVPAKPRGPINLEYNPDDDFFTAPTETKKKKGPGKKA